MKIFAFDYETFYSKEYSIRDLGNWAYVNHPLFDAYMLAVSCDEGEWVGHPKDFDWELLRGQLVIAHNAGFESAVTERLKELGVVPKDLEFGELVDTADLAAYLGVPRNLAGAASALLGVKPDKSMRDKAKGVDMATASPEFQAAMTRYAAQDAILERRLWLEHSHKWPEWERLLSRLTREMTAFGLPMDVARVDEGITALESALRRTRKRIPWADDPKAKVLSPKAVKLECAKHGITPPTSMAKTSEEFDVWLKQHGDKLPWARAMGELRSINMKLKKLHTIKTRTRPDGMMPYALKYGGAHTLRDSGDAGFNPQNLDRLPFLFRKSGVITKLDEVQTLAKAYKNGTLSSDVTAVDMRKMITAPEGYTLGVIDLSAIEPCALTTFCGDEEMRLMLKNGMDPYEAQARADGEYDDPRPLKDVDPHLRQYNKVKVLGCGYGAGPDKVQVIAKLLVGLDLTLAETTTLVGKFRGRGFVKDLWTLLEAKMRSKRGEDFTMELPSGRVMLYRDVRDYRGLQAIIPRNGMFLRLGFWGGTLTENLVQAAARDVFMDGYLRVCAAGYRVILRVHDEVVCLFREETAAEDLKEVIRLMSINPEWWPELPLSADGHLCKAYEK